MNFTSSTSSRVLQNVMHAPAAGWTRLSFNLSVVKLALGRVDAVDVKPTTKGMWIATERGLSITEGELRQVGESKSAIARPLSGRAEEVLSIEPTWKTDLLQVLTSVPPDAFERLSQRLSRQFGFLRVEVTGKSGGRSNKGVRGELRSLSVASP